MTTTNLNSDITDSNTTAIICKKENYSPFITIIQNKKEIIEYIPLKFERKLIQYHITMSQEIHSDGKAGRSFFNIEIDNTKNLITSRYEILDL